MQCPYNGSSSKSCVYVCVRAVNGAWWKLQCFGVFCYRPLPWSLFELCHRAASQQNTTLWLCCERYLKKDKEKVRQRKKEKERERGVGEGREKERGRKETILYVFKGTVLCYHLCVCVCVYRAAWECVGCRENPSYCAECTVCRNLNE